MKLFGDDTSDQAKLTQLYALWQQPITIDIEVDINDPATREFFLCRPGGREYLMHCLSPEDQQQLTKLLTRNIMTPTFQTIQIQKFER